MPIHRRTKEVKPTPVKKPEPEFIIKRDQDYHFTNMPGRKDDADKVRFDLSPPEVEIAVARVLTKGSWKYEARNWEKGIKYGRCYAAARRHMAHWWSGNSIDEDNGEHPLANAICMLTFLLAYELRNGNEENNPLDDRPDNTPDVEMIIPRLQQEQR